MKLLLRVVLWSVAAWLGGFVGYWLIVSNMQSDVTTPCDALVVLTGSNGRVPAGFELFDQGRAPVLFITGVGDDRRADAFLEAFKPHPALKRKLSQPGAFEIDYKATSTYGNAEQTMFWLRDKNYKQLCLVTAHYHMPRSMLVFNSLMPEYEWVPTVVYGNDVKPEETWGRMAMFRVMVFEYHKLIVTWLLETFA